MLQKLEKYRKLTSKLPYIRHFILPGMLCSEAGIDQQPFPIRKIKEWLFLFGMFAVIAFYIQSWKIMITSLTVILQNEQKEQEFLNKVWPTSSTAERIEKVEYRFRINWYDDPSRHPTEFQQFLKDIALRKLLSCLGIGSNIRPVADYIDFICFSGRICYFKSVLRSIDSQKNYVQERTNLVYYCNQIGLSLSFQFQTEHCLSQRCVIKTDSLQSKLLKKQLSIQQKITNIENQKEMKAYTIKRPMLSQNCKILNQSQFNEEMDGFQKIQNIIKKQDTKLQKCQNVNWEDGFFKQNNMKIANYCLPEILNKISTFSIGANISQIPKDKEYKISFLDRCISMIRQGNYSSYLYRDLKEKHKQTLKFIFKNQAFLEKLKCLQQYKLVSQFKIQDSSLEEYPKQHQILDFFR